MWEWINSAKESQAEESRGDPNASDKVEGREAIKGTEFVRERTEKKGHYCYFTVRNVCVSVPR